MKKVLIKNLEDGDYFVLGAYIAKLEDIHFGIVEVDGKLTKISNFLQGYGNEETLKFEDTKEIEPAMEKLKNYRALKELKN